MIFPDIESYIEFIAGLKDINSKKIGWFASPVLQLASYDVGFITSVAEQVTQNKGMSDRQAALVEKLIIKYERQLKKLGVDQPNHRNYRYGLREVDRSSSLTLIDGGGLYLRFPFSNEKILSVKEFAKTSQGKVAWDKDARAWVFSLTEYNLSWVVEFCKSNNILIDAKCQDLFNLILEAEKVPFKIELQYDGKRCFIKNAPESLNEYVAKNIGFNNIYSLVDSAGALGYTVSEEISKVMVASHGEPFMDLCSKREIDFTPQERSIDEILSWAIAVDRLPICVYNPNFMNPDLGPYRKFFNEDEIRVISMRDIVSEVEVTPAVKLVYTNKILSGWNGRLPLLITYANLMHGANKRTFLTQAEKIVYYCARLPKR